MAPSFTLGGGAGGVGGAGLGVLGGGGHHNYQPFSLDAFVVDSPRAGSKVPRYPLEKQRRAWKELEEKKQQQQMQPSSPMTMIATTSSSSDRAGFSSSTSTLPLTPAPARTPVSSASSRYSEEQDELDNGKSKSSSGPLPRSFCASIFGSCFAVFYSSSQRIEGMQLRQGITSAR